MAGQKLREITNPGKTMLSFNYDTIKNGKRESGILIPRQIMAITEEQFNSHEVRKLRARGLIVDMTAAEARRKQREAEQRGQAAPPIPAP